MKKIKQIRSKKVSELKKMIVNLQVDNARLQVQTGNCPLSFFEIRENKDCGCDCNTDCDECTEKFWEQFEKDRIAEVKAL